MPRLSRSAVLVATVPVVFAACLGADTVSSDAGLFPEVYPYAHTYTLKAAPNSRRFVSMQLNRRAYHGRVTLRLDSVPEGVTVTFDKPVLAPEHNGALITIDVAPDAPVQTGNIVIRATAPFVRSGTLSISLEVE